MHFGYWSSADLLNKSQKSATITGLIEACIELFRSGHVIYLLDFLLGQPVQSKNYVGIPGTPYLICSRPDWYGVPGILEFLCYKEHMVERTIDKPL